MANHSVTANPASFACDECRLRKYRCSKQKPACASCLRHGRACHYSPSIQRTPLTRRHLTDMENRCARLEAMLSELLPGIDVDTMLSLQRDQQSPSPLQSPELRSAIEEPIFDVGAPETKKIKVEKTEAEPPSEILPQEADGFDWAEKADAVDNLTDGMAALSIRPEGAGYLGASSSVVFVRSLFKGSSNINPMNRLREYPSSSKQRQKTPPLSIIRMPDSVEARQLSSTLIDAYFRYYHTTYPFIHEPTFRAQYNQLIKRPEEHAWNMLLNTVLALGAWTICDDETDLDDNFYREARRYAQDESIFEWGNLTLVQALLLLSNYTQKRNKPNTGWNYLGLAVRMALSLGLHREFPEWNISFLQREMRRRVWWGLFIFDSGASTTFGRPILLPDSEMVDVKHVLNIQDEALTPATTTNPTESNEPTLYSSLIAQTNLHLATNSLSNHLLAVEPLTPSEALTLNKSIDVWNSRLPWYFQPTTPCPLADEAFILARYRLQWRAWNLRIILFRPIVMAWMNRLVRGDGATKSQSKASAQTVEEQRQCLCLCQESAHLTIWSIDEYITTITHDGVCISNNNANNNDTSTSTHHSGEITRLASWYSLFFLFHAALIPLVSLLAAPTDPRATEWRDDIAVVKALLAEVCPRNVLASRCLAVINGLTVQHPAEQATTNDCGASTALNTGDSGDYVTASQMVFMSNDEEHVKVASGHSNDNDSQEVVVDAAVADADTDIDASTATGESALFNDLFSLWSNGWSEFAGTTGTEFGDVGFDGVVPYGL